MASGAKATTGAKKPAAAKPPPPGLYLYNFILYIYQRPDFIFSPRGSMH